MSAREIPEVVACPICQNAEWHVLNEDGSTIRIMGMDERAWYPIDTDAFRCSRCGFLRFHWTDTPPVEAD
jgi:hypothetical protein